MGPPFLAPLPPPPPPPPRPLTHQQQLFVDCVDVCSQASVYLARSGKGNARRVKARSVHAPARRLARTTISLGPDEGIAFGLRAVRCYPQALSLTTPPPPPPPPSSPLGLAQREAQGV